MDLICSLYSWWEGFGSSSFATLSWVSIVVLFPPLHVGRPVEFAPVRARCGGGAAAWVAGVLAAPGTQGGWWLVKQEIYSALEGYGNQYWPICPSILTWRTPLPDREAWQASVYRVSKSQTLPKRPCVRRPKTFFACGSSAPVRVEHEVGAAAWLAGTLAAPSVQGHKLLPWQELGPSESFLEPLVAGYQKASLASLSP